MFNLHSENITLLLNKLELTTFDCVSDIIKKNTENDRCLEFPDFAANLILELVNKEEELRV